MAAKNTNNNDNNVGFNIDSLKNICSKYKKYIATGAMLILLGVVITSSRSASGNPDDKTTDQVSTAGDDQTQTDEEKFEVDAYPEVNALFEEYYGYYAKGDTDSIAKIARPIQDTEVSYIKTFSEYIDRYENIKCYTKKGIEEDEFVVSVSVDMMFKDIETGAPDLGCFYVRKDENGAYYIDNVYSQFNHRKSTMDVEINTLMTEYMQDADVIELTKEVQKEYEKALEKDEKLRVMANETLKDAISDWVASFSMQTSTDDPDDEKDGKTDQKDKDKDKNKDQNQDTNTDDNEGQQTNTDNEQNNETDSKTDDNETDSNAGQTTVLKRTAYATTEVNMREKRSINSELIRTLKKGSEVTIYGYSKNGWFKIKYKDKTGFARKEYFTTDKSKVEKKDNKPKDTDTNTSSVTTRTAYAKTKVNMRAKRSTDSKVIKTLKAGTEITIYGKSKNNWFKVKYKGKTGYIRKEYVVSDKSKVEKKRDTQPQTPSSPTYYNEGDRITLSESVNVRQSMSENADRVGLAYQGDVVTVIMSYAEGWTKVSWNGQTGYVKTEYLQ